MRRVFSVACQIFFSDPNKLREETGLTQSWWENGSLRVRHRDDPAIQVPYPCAYGGGGSCAFDRRKFLELGGFDELLAPFYLEDTDIGYMAWKRGWKVLYQPRSVVYHEHRGTIGKRFSAAQIDLVLKKNFALFCWKNIHEWPRLCVALLLRLCGRGGDGAFRRIAGARQFRRDCGGPSVQLPGAMGSRARARELAVIDDTEAFHRPLGGYFRDRFAALSKGNERLSVLFVSPYPICPPIHGGGVFMYQTALELTRLCELHLLILLDYAWQREPHQELERQVASAEYLVRTEGKEKQFGSILPHAVREFASQDFEWRLHREMYLREIDVVQLEYTALSQYGGDYRRLACVLFEHDIYFQSIARGSANPQGHDRKRARRLTNICARCAMSCVSCRASIACKFAARRTATTCSRSCRACAAASTTTARASRRRATNFTPMDASRRPCCFSEAFAILPIRKG